MVIMHVGVRLAFATGECGQEIWNSDPENPVLLGKESIDMLNDAGIPYAISTGGAGRVFTCSSQSGADTFLNRYTGPLLQGLDFDIEIDMTPNQLSDLMKNALYLQRKNPKLTISFTLASSAASTGESIGPLGESVLNAAKAVGLEYVVNLMAMNYYSESSCMVGGNSGKYDMGESAIQAAKNLNEKYGVPFPKIALTPMIGKNDNPVEVFTFDDMTTMLDFSAKFRLAGVHYWSFDRDRQCTSSSIPATCTCSGVEQTPLQYYGMLVNANTPGSHDEF